jgi:hypothetical protein
LLGVLTSPGRLKCDIRRSHCPGFRGHSQQSTGSSGYTSYCRILCGIEFIRHNTSPPQTRRREYQ